MTKRIMREFQMNEISAVDRPAQKGARAVIMKRDFSDKERQALADSGAAMPDGGFPIETTGDLENAVHAIGRANDPAAAKAHIIARAKALGHPELLPDGWVSKSAGDGNNPAHAGEITMDEAELNKKIGDAVKVATADITKKLTDAETRLAEVAKAETLTPAEKEFMAGLAPAERGKFLAAEAGERSAMMAKRSADDAVVYKSADGVEFRKSDDPRLIAMAKRADESEKVAKAERDARETAEFAKRAETEIARLPGDATTKGLVLKHLAGAPEEVRKAGEAMLKAGDEAMAKMLRPIGSDAGRSFSKAEDELTSLAKAHADKHSVSFAKAYDAVLKSDEGRRLYAETQKPQAAA